MLTNVLVATTLFVNLSLPIAFDLHLPEFSPPREKFLATETISLNNRQPFDAFGNEVFKDNILLNLAYLRGFKQEELTWEEARTPFTHVIRFYPGQTMAYHDTVLPEYQGRIAWTTNSHFNTAEGFKSVYGLAGNGVCHLASLMYWVSKDAELDAYAPTNHNFADIPEISKEYGVSIHSSSARQNLYITNNKENPILFKIDYDGNNLKISLYEELNGRMQTFL